MIKPQNATFEKNRRDFIHQGIQIVMATSVSGILLFGCKEKEDEEKKVSPPEDLMQEHGLLNRILLIYDHCKEMLTQKQSFDTALLLNSAGILRSFVEDYHEKQEEDYLFPRFQKANQLTDLVRTLKQQHDAGRAITSQVMQLTRARSLTNDESEKLISLLTNFNIMYRPHESREDTVLFPAFRKLVSQHEYDSLGENSRTMNKNILEKMVLKQW